MFFIHFFLFVCCLSYLDCVIVVCLNAEEAKEIISTLGFNNTDIIVNEEYFIVSLDTLIFEKQ